ncbi:MULTISPECIES: hypothetical protein [unclassified Bradyrhizobium]|uniref:hypothetical protein n=1 Tax=unclassified Bradyrhizobium TaxID=2631580 RepID=UPI00339B56AF
MDWREQVINMAQQAVAGFTPAPASPQPFSAGISLTPTFDVIELLPEAAADKLRALRQRSDDLHAIIPPGEDVRQASMAKIDAANALRRLTDHPQDFGFGLKPDDRRVIEAQRTLEKATADFERLKQLQETRAAAWQSASQAKAACEGYLRHGVPGYCQIDAAVDVGPPNLNKGETILDAVERHRRRCRELKADLHRIQSAPFPSVYAKQQMREQIEALALLGVPTVSLLIEHDGRIVWPMQMIRSEVRGGEHPALAFAEMHDAVALVAWLHKDALIAALDREIASEADDKAAMSHEARQKAEAETMGDLLAVERHEAALVWRAQAQGLPVEHRSDINPLALLGVRLVTVSRSDALPETTPGFSWDVRR